MFRYLLLLMCLSAMSASCYEPLGDRVLVSNLDALEGVCREVEHMSTYLTRSGALEVEVTGSPSVKYEREEGNT